uniref:Riboflavin transporter n=1 Tax=Capitella teleta TaxID=283909 RepID=X1Z3Y5_CAPTE
MSEETDKPEDDLAEDDLQEVRPDSGCLGSCTNISISVYLLICCFSMAAWIDMFGLWVEMPILVEVLPESWALPAYLTIIMKAGNIAPIIYGVVNKLCPGNTRKREAFFTYIIIGTGAAACLMLSLFWKKTLSYRGSEHSVGFFCLASVLSVVDCTSALVFLPFMANFPPLYMTAYCIGEGLSGLIPALVGLMQGAGSTAQCVNVSTAANESYHRSRFNASDGSTLYYDTVAVYEEPRFRVEFYFLFLFFILLLSGAAFTMLLIMPLSKKHQKLALALRAEEKEAREMQVMTSPDEVKEEAVTSRPSNARFVSLLLLNTWMCTVFYGMAPAMLPYACLPYGALTYSLAIRLSAVAIPLASLVSFWLKTSSVKVITLLTGVGTLLSIYPLFLATQSPDLPLADTAAGSALIVIVCIVCASVFSYAYTVNHVLIQREFGHRGLLWTGGTTQLGSLIGGIVILICVLKVFVAHQPCT